MIKKSLYTGIGAVLILGVFSCLDQTSPLFNEPVSLGEHNEEQLMNHPPLLIAKKTTSNSIFPGIGYGCDGMTFTNGGGQVYSETAVTIPANEKLVSISIAGSVVSDGHLGCVCADDPGNYRCKPGFDPEDQEFEQLKFSYRIGGVEREFNPSTSSDCNGSGQHVQNCSYSGSDAGADLGSGPVTLIVRHRNYGANAQSARLNENGSISVVTENRNTPPVVIIDPIDTVYVNKPGCLAEVALNGSQSYDPDGDVLTYQWSDAASGTSAATSVELPPGMYSARLTVSDGNGGVDSDTVLFVVANRPPVAEISPSAIIDTIAGLTGTYDVDGSGSVDPDGLPLSYSWSFPQGTSSEIAPTLELPFDNFDITLEVSDGCGVIDTAMIPVSIVNLPPVADAGLDTIITATEAGCVSHHVLDGSNSFDPEKGALTYSWNHEGVLYTGATPALELEVGVHAIILTVTDQGNQTDIDTVVVTVNVCELFGGIDTHVGHIHGGPNQNHGAEEALILQGSGKNQNLILTRFDYGTIPLDKVSSAKVTYTVSKAAVGCGGKKGVVTQMHKMNTAWTAGNGVFNVFNGTGSGVTYNCIPSDEDISNNQMDCSGSKWKGSSDVYEPTTGTDVIISKGQEGTISYDVTGDFINDPLNGWLLRNENTNGCNVSLYSTEGAPNAVAAPGLTISFEL